MAILTPITKKRVLYSDFDKDLTIHPVSNDVSRKLNEEAIKESIRNLILTDRGERPFQPNVGSSVRAMLFENLTQSTISTIKAMVTETIETYEPRCQLIGVDVTALIDSNDLTVSIVFATRNAEDPVRLDLVLNRVR